MGARETPSPSTSAGTRQAGGHGLSPAADRLTATTQDQRGAFLDELLWLSTYVGDERFNQAYVAVHESGAIKDGKWAKDFSVSSPPGHTSDPFQSCAFHVARMTIAFASERLALAWAVATFDLPGKTFDGAIARMRKALRAAEKAGAMPV